MPTPLIIVTHPFVNVLLKFIQSLIHLFAESNLVELIENRFMKAFAIIHILGIFTTAKNAVETKSYKNLTSKSTCSLCRSLMVTLFQTNCEIFLLSKTPYFGLLIHLLFSLEKKTVLKEII